MQDSNQGLWKRISSRLNARWQTDWYIKDQAKNLDTIANPYDQRAFSPLDPITGWLVHLALAIYTFPTSQILINLHSNNHAYDISILREWLWVS